ncbi:MAG: transglutaminase domain-containing protein, partial [Bacteroidota bacterium]
MKPLLTLILPCLLSLTAAAQFDYSKVDGFVAQFEQDYTDAADLARQLTQPFDSAQTKARAIFMWLAHNVRYDVDKFRNPPPSPRFHSKAEAAEWQEKELRKTLKNKKGVCADYSRLCKQMCDAVGLECEVVSGDARDFYRPYKNIHDNPHAWNAVKWGGKWHLLDATWGAGYLDGSKFVRRISTGYFDAPPAWFAQNHLPDDDKWQLLESPVSKKDFPDQPIVNFGQDEYPLLDFSQKVEREDRQS